MTIDAVSTTTSGLSALSALISGGRNSEWEEIKQKLRAYGYASTGSYEGDKALLARIELEIQMAKEAASSPVQSTQKAAQNVLTNYNVGIEESNKEDELTIVKDEENTDTSMVGSNYLSELNKFFLIRGIT